VVRYCLLVIYCIVCLYFDMKGGRDIHQNVGNLLPDDTAKMIFIFKNAVNLKIYFLHNEMYCYEHLISIVSNMHELASWYLILNI
jgi:hypothetical protein